MAHETRTINGYKVNLTTNKTGTVVRAATVLVGPAEKPGWRAQDGPEAKRKRREAKRAVMAALNLPAKQVRAASRYTELTVGDDGMVERRDADGRVVGVYKP